MNRKRNRAKAVFARWLAKHGYGTVTIELAEWIAVPADEDSFVFVTRDRFAGAYLVIDQEVSAMPRNEAARLIALLR